MEGTKQQFFHSRNALLYSQHYFSVPLYQPDYRNKILDQFMRHFINPIKNKCKNRVRPTFLLVTSMTSR